MTAATVRVLLADLGTAHDFAGAPCVGRWALFDPASTYEPPADVAERHEAARHLCATCPLEHFAACAALARSIPKPHRTGVWAGTAHHPKETR